MSAPAKHVPLICAIQPSSVLDERTFFDWVSKIDCIEKYEVHLVDIHLYVVADEIHEYSLRDLLALFYRYDINMSQLKRFLIEENKKWFFDNHQSYWHQKVFGN